MPDHIRSPQLHKALLIVAATLLPGPLLLTLTFFTTGVFDIAVLIPLAMTACLYGIGGRKIAVGAGLTSAGTVYLFDLIILLTGFDCNAPHTWSLFLPADCTENGAGSFWTLLVGNFAILLGFAVAAVLIARRRR